MTTQLLPNVVQTFKDASGNALSGGKLYAYAAGTTTPQDTYTDFGGLTPNANPVILNSAGQAGIWLSSLAYKFKLMDSSNNLIWTADNVSIINPGSIDKTKINGNIANIALAQNGTGSLDVQVDNVTIQINGSNQLEVKQLTADNFPASSKLEVVTKNVRDYSSAGLFQQIPQYSWTSPTLLSNPTTLPPGAAKCTKWSPNGEFLAVSATGTPFIDIYQICNSVLTKLANPSLPAGTANQIAWSACGDFLVAGSTSTPFLRIYLRTGNTFTVQSQPGSALSTTADTIAFSPNSDFLAASTTGSTFKMYYRNLATFTDITGTSTISGVSGYLAWSPDSSMFAALDNSSHVIDVFSRADQVFSGITPPSLGTYAGNITAFEFSPDGNFLAVAVNVSPYILIFQIVNGVFSQLSNPSLLPAGVADCVSWSANSGYLAVGHSTTPFITIYQISGTTFTKISNPGVLPAAAVVSADWSPTKQYLAVASGTTPYIQVYKTASTLTSNALLWAPEAPNV